MIFSGNSYRAKQIFEIRKRIESIDTFMIAKIIAGDIRKNIGTGTDVRGNELKPLKTSTIKQKQRKGNPLPSKVLYAKGILYKSILAKKVNKNMSVVYIKDKRAGRTNVGNKFILDIQTKLYDRTIFGITKRALTEISKRKENYG